MTAANRISLADISKGQQLEGTIKKVTLSGAILDVGASVDGLLHISDLGQKGVTRTSDVLSEGQSVTVWVKRLDLAGGRLSLLHGRTHVGVVNELQGRFGGAGVLEDVDPSTVARLAVDEDAPAHPRVAGEPGAQFDL